MLVHRKIQGIDLTEEDLQGKTCPYVFEYPCSPHLAAKRESRKIEAKSLKNLPHFWQKNMIMYYWRVLVA